MSNANRLGNEHIPLPDDRVLHVRQLWPGEDDAVRELCARLSERTRHRRFLSPLPFSDSLARMLPGVDDGQQFALIAQLEPANGGDVIALGNVAGTDDDRAEVALVVADAWQRQGIGVALAARLLHTAELRGYRRFVVHVRTDNPAAWPLLHQVADVVSTASGDGVSEIAFTRRQPVMAFIPGVRNWTPADAIRCPTLVEATTEGEALYNASRERKAAVKDVRERVYERILAAER